MASSVFFCRHSTPPMFPLSVPTQSACLPSMVGRPSTINTSSCSSSTTFSCSSGVPTLWRPWARSPWQGPSPHIIGHSKSLKIFPPAPSVLPWAGPFGQWLNVCLRVVYVLCGRETGVVLSRWGNVSVGLVRCVWCSQLLSASSSGPDTTRVLWLLVR